METVEERIGEGLIRIGAMNQSQVTYVLKRQKDGDDRLFGEIAVELGYVDVDALLNYLKFKNEVV